MGRCQRRVIGRDADNELRRGAPVNELWEDRVDGQRVGTGFGGGCHVMSMSYGRGNEEFRCPGDRSSHTGLPNKKSWVRRPRPMTCIMGRCTRLGAGAEDRREKERRAIRIAAIADDIVAPPAGGGPRHPRRRVAEVLGSPPTYWRKRRPPAVLSVVVKNVGGRTMITISTTRMEPRVVVVQTGEAAQVTNRRLFSFLEGAGAAYGGGDETRMIGTDPARGGG